MIVFLTDLIKEHEEEDLKNQSWIICALCIMQSFFFIFGLFAPRTSTKDPVVATVSYMRWMPETCNGALFISTCIFPFFIGLSIVQAKVLIDEYPIIASLMGFTLTAEALIFVNYLWTLRHKFQANLRDSKVERAAIFLIAGEYEVNDNY